jgi:hypothetical protein
LGGGNRHRPFRTHPPNRIPTRYRLFSIRQKPWLNGTLRKATDPCSGFFEALLLCHIRVEISCERDLEVINMNVHVARRPMTLIVARLMSKLGSLRASPLFKQAKLCVACSEYGDSGDLVGVLRKSKSVYVETNSVCRMATDAEEKRALPCSAARPGSAPLKCGRFNRHDHRRGRSRTDRSDRRGPAYCVESGKHSTIHASRGDGCSVNVV